MDESREREARRREARGARAATGAGAGRKSHPAGSESTAPARQVILVLGMHRSGTSALAGVLARLGAQAPRWLVRGNKDNERGYWESGEFNQYHDRLLGSAGSRWMDWDRFNPEWLDSPVAAQYAAEFPGIIEREFGTSPLFTVKDPRICRFLPFWARQARALGIEPRAVIPIRNPLEVARSLEKRDGFSTGRSLLIWLRNVLDAEFETRRMKRSFVRYEDLLRDWRRVAARISRDLGVKWPKQSNAVELEIESFLTAELRHHALDGDIIDQGLSGLVKRTYRALTALVDKHDDAARRNEAQAVLDDVRQEFDRVTGMVGPVVRQYEDRTEALAQELAALGARLEESAKQGEELAKALKETQRARDAAVMETAKRVAEIGQLNRQVAELRRNLEDAARVKRLLQTQISQGSEENARLQAEVRRLQAEARTRAGKLQAAEALAAERQARLDILAQRNSMLRVDARRLRIPGRLKQRRNFAREARLVADSGLFDQAWYLERNPDVRGKDTDPVRHYLDHGAWEGRDPNPWFDSAWYLWQYRDVFAANLNPLLHYLVSGAKEGRNPGPRFNTLDYLARTPEARESTLNPLAHFIMKKAREK